MREKIIYEAVYEIYVASTGVNSNQETIVVDTPEDVAFTVHTLLGEIRSFEWITVRRQEIRASDQS